MNPSPDSDRRFAEALASGNEAAWREFLARYGRLLYAIAGRLGLNEEDREEVFQQACLSVYTSIHTLRDPAKLSSWLYGMTYRLAVDVFRRNQRLSRHERTESDSGVYHVEAVGPCNSDLSDDASVLVESCGDGD